MQCPICGGYEQRSMEMKIGQFREDLSERSICGSSWSINHGHVELVEDTQSLSFLQGETESVEGVDYTWAA